MIAMIAVCKSLNPDFILLMLFISISLSLTDCAGMNAQQIRAALDEYEAYDLLGIPRFTSERKVLRCIPKKRHCGLIGNYAKAGSWTNAATTDV